MTASPVRDPATASTEAVAGLRLATDRERDVDHQLQTVAAGLGRHGVRVTWLTTHRTVTDAGVACTGAVTAATAADLLTGYLYVVTRELADVVDVVAVDGDDALAAAAARRDRSEGRAVWFPGHDGVGDEITVADLLDRTAVDRVEVLGAGAADGRTVVQTRGFLRPRFVAGQLVLHVQPARGGVLVPFETPSPTPCCVDHT